MLVLVLGCWLVIGGFADLMTIVSVGNVGATSDVLGVEFAVKVVVKVGSAVRLTIFSDSCELVGSGGGIGVGIGEEVCVFVGGGATTIPLSVVMGALFSSLMLVLTLGCKFLLTITSGSCSKLDCCTATSGGCPFTESIWAELLPAICSIRMVISLPIFRKKLLAKVMSPLSVRKIGFPFVSRLIINPLKIEPA